MTSSADDSSGSPKRPIHVESHGYLSKSWDLLAEGLAPYIADILKDSSIRSTRDIQKLLASMEGLMDSRSGGPFVSFGRSTRSHVVILREARNPWAHQGEYSDYDVLYYLRTIENLLKSISATELAGQVWGFYIDLVGIVFGEHVEREKRNLEPMDHPDHDESEETSRGRRTRSRNVETVEETDLEERAGTEGSGSRGWAEPASDGNAGIVEEFLALGRAAVQDGKVEVAAILFDVVRRLDSEVRFGREDAAVYVARGKVRTLEGNHSSAIADYGVALEIDPDLSIGSEFAAALEGRAQLLSPIPRLGYCGEQFYEESAQMEVSEQDHRQAIVDYTEAIKWDPQNSRAHYHNRGLVHFALAEYEKALEDFSSSLEKDSGEGDAYYNRGDAYYNRGQVHLVNSSYESAISDFESADSEKGANRVKSARRGSSSHGGKPLIRAVARCSALLRLDSRNAEVLLERGEAYTKVGKHDQGRADYDRARMVDATRAAETFLLRGRSYHAQGNYDQAVSDFDEAVILDSDIDLALDYAETYGMRGLARFKTKNYELALSDFSSVLKHIPGHEGAYFDRGRVHYAKREYSEAMSDFKEALRIIADGDGYYDEEGDFNYPPWDEVPYIDDFPEEYRVRFHLGRAYAGARNHIDAIDAFSRVLEEIQDDHDIMQDEYGVAVFNNRGNAYFRLEEYEQAIQDYTSAMGWGHSIGNPVLWRNRGLARYHSRLNEDALEDFDVFLRHRPNDELVLTCKADAASHLEAEEEFSVRDPGDFASWYDRGCHYADSGDDQQALSDFNEALLRHERALGQQSHGDLELLSPLEAAVSGASEEGSTFEVLTRHISDRTDILLARAEVLSSLGQNEAAWQDLERIIKLRPDFAVAWYRRGRVRQQEENFGAAIREYDKAIDLDEKFKEAHYSRGVCHYQLGDAERARRDIDAAYEHGFRS